MAKKNRNSQRSTAVAALKLSISIFRSLSKSQGIIGITPCEAIIDNHHVPSDVDAEMGGPSDVSSLVHLFGSGITNTCAVWRKKSGL